MSPVVTFYDESRTEAENATYALVRRGFLEVAMRHGLVDLYEYIALGLSGTDIGNSVDAGLLQSAILLGSPEFVRVSLDNLQREATEDPATWHMVRETVASSNAALHLGLAGDAQLRSELRLPPWDAARGG